MKRCIPIIIVLGLLVSCNNNKKDSNSDISDSVTKPEIDTTVTAPAEPAPAKKEAEPRSAAPVNGKNEILANIDQYLISKPSISNAALVVENTLKDATIIKAYAEVTIIDAAGKELRKDFLILENISPNDSKSVRIPDVTNAAKITSHIIRLKSNELTDGETILVGSHYVPK